MEPTIQRRILISLGGMLLVAVMAFLGLMLLAWVWPLPRGQGLAYAAHAVLALGGGAVSALGFLIANLVQPQRSRKWLIIAIVVAWTISVCIWSMR